ncbi:uncharacterized protein LOC126716865 isoform X2 [Quercus robur]|uniref:uncharacterized protein LOC126716865 isoform X2 n=1 Tax=Quercus robur TaxID=38942 RepID=UPI0021613730|nr:uncharacterized protein LOC126716865 isoform X2 [Quercus robur]
MDLPNWFQALPFILLKFLNWYFHFFNLAWPYILLLLLDPLFSHFFKIELGEFYPFRPKAANLLFLGSDDYKRSVILNLSDEDEGIFGIETPPYSRLSSMGRIKFNLFDFGELRTACRVWKDYCAKVLNKPLKLHDGTQIDQNCPQNGVTALHYTTSDSQMHRMLRCGARFYNKKTAPFPCVFVYIHMVSGQPSVSAF